MRIPHHFYRLIGAAAIAPFLAAWSLHAATLPSGFSEIQYGANVGSSPTAMEFAPDGRLFVCLQGGDLRVISNGTLLLTSFVTVTTTANGERGLLGIAFDPNFASNQFVYVYYTVSAAPIHNRISHFTANGDVAVAGSEMVILELDNLSSATNHNGGAIHFGPDGKLYVAVGENANSANAQTVNNRLGKLLRINSDGTIPPGNPTTFPGIAGSPSGDNQAIWAVGLRNPFTFGFQRGTGRLFINDVGESTWEEINDGIAGSNYGWSICEGFCSPPNANYRDPLFEYGHGGGSTTGCAIVGGAFYSPAINQFPAFYSGKYFFGDLCSGWIRLFDPSNNTATGFATGISSLVDLKVGPEGSLYYLARGNGGQVWKVSAATATPSPTPAPNIISGTVSYCPDPGSGPVPSVTLTLTGSASGAVLTDTSGHYTFSSLASGGTYTVTPSKPDRAPGSAGIDTIDVVAVQRHFLVLGTPLSGCRLTAADVDLNSSVNTVDVVAIQRFFLGLSTGIAQTGKYRFTPVNRSYSPLTSNQNGQNYDTLVFGDVVFPFAELAEGVEPQ
jgi:glucose/arabinose dehydrogenase